MSEIWHYIPGDTYTDGRLQTIKKYYEDKIDNDLLEYVKLKLYQKYGIPGFRWMMIHTKMEWDNNELSLENVIRAIEAGQEIKDED